MKKIILSIKFDERSLAWASSYCGSILNSGEFNVREGDSLEIGRVKIQAEILEVAKKTIKRGDVLAINRLPFENNGISKMSKDERIIYGIDGFCRGLSAGMNYELKYIEEPKDGLVDSFSRENKVSKLTAYLVCGAMNC